MIRYAWKIKNQTTAVNWTDSVLSFNLTNGRQNYLDNYNAGALVLTIKNQNNEVAGFNFGDEIQLLDFDDEHYLSFYVVQVEYNDYPGNVGLSTASITCQDSLGLMGRLQMYDFPITAGLSGAQFLQTSSVPGFKVNRPILTAFGDTSSSCSASTYSGSVLNFWNLLQNTERGVLAIAQQAVYFISRSGINTLGTNGPKFNRVASATQVGYDSFQRINLGLDLMNQVQTQPEGLAVQQATNPTSITAVGAQGFTVSTVDANTTQALGLAEWLANTLSDTNKQRFVVTFTDRMQVMTPTAFSVFLFLVNDKTPGTVTYQIPGDSTDRTEKIIVEGIQISATPTETVVTAYLTPLTYYQFFILNNSTFGILGGDGIVYNQPEIEYDEVGWIYDDANVEQGSRLGW